MADSTDNNIACMMMHVIEIIVYTNLYQMNTNFERSHFLRFTKL